MREIINIGEDRYEVIFVYPLQKFNTVDTDHILKYSKHSCNHCDTVLRSKSRNELLVCRKIATAKYTLIQSSIIPKE